jgi:quinol monooxygenase YgiN
MAASLGAAAIGFPAFATANGGKMYGLIGKMLAAPGQRDALLAILLEGTQAMPGCFSYVIATDPGNPDAIWITEVWDDEESHKASLALPAVREAIQRARPLIAGFGERFTTVPVGGHGLVKGAG